MALTQSIVSLVTDGQGYATKTFLETTPTEWADAQMKVRYGHTVLDTDGAYTFARLCYDQLVEERKSLSSWFDDSGKLNPTLQSAFMSNKLHGAIGDGIGWDFKPNGDPEHRMTIFKGTLVAASRSADLIPQERRNRGNMQFGGLATMIRSAYTERAALHTWRGDEDLSGADMSRRWVAHMTFVFLLRLGAERTWAWDASRSRTVFGPVEERGWM